MNNLKGLGVWISGFDSSDALSDPDGAFFCTRGTTYTEHVRKTIDLRDFKYLVIKESVNLTITPAGKSQLEIRSAKEEEMPRVKYRQLGDTLFLDEINFGSGGRSLFVTLIRPLTIFSG